MCATMHRSSPLRSTLNRNGITGLDMCTDAVHLRSTLNSNVITGVDTVKNFNPPVAKAINELPRYLERLRVHPTSLLFLLRRREPPLEPLSLLSWRSWSFRPCQKCQESISRSTATRNKQSTRLIIVANDLSSWWSLCTTRAQAANTAKARKLLRKSLAKQIIVKHVATSRRAFQKWNLPEPWEIKTWCHNFWNPFSNELQTFHESLLQKTFQNLQQVNFDFRTSGNLSKKKPLLPENLGKSFINQSLLPENVPEPLQ